MANYVKTNLHKDRYNDNLENWKIKLQIKSCKERKMLKITAKKIIKHRLGLY